MMIVMQTQLPARDPLEGLIYVGIALVIVLVIGVAFQARDDIFDFVKGIAARYIRVERRHHTPTPIILSSSDSKLDPFDELYNAVRGGTYQHEPDSAIPPSEPVRPSVLHDDDIITWLALLKNPGKTAYRFSANQIALMIGGTRNDVLKKVAAHRPDAARKPDISSLDTKEKVERVMIAREHRDGQLIEREIAMEP